MTKQICGKAYLKKHIGSVQPQFPVQQMPTAKYEESKTHNVASYGSFVFALICLSRIRDCDRH